MPTIMHVSWRAVLIAGLLFLTLTSCAPGSGVPGSGGSWQVAGLQQQQVRLLAVDPHAPQNLFAGTQQGRIFTSNDAGTHWNERSALSSPLHGLSFDPQGKYIYAATKQGLWKSSDGAQHWTAVAELSTLMVTALTFDNDAPDIIYVGTQQQGVLRGKNSGSTWTQLTTAWPQGSSVNDLLFDAHERWLWAATNQGVYRTHGGGEAWQQLATGLPSGISINTVQPATTSGGSRDLVYLGTTKGFYRSSDAGQHWSTSRSSLGTVNVRSVLIDFRSRDAATVYIGTDFGAFRSDNAGLDWDAVAKGLPKETKVFALALGAQNYAQLYAVADSIYLYPGTGGGLSPSRILFFLVVLVFFYLLYRLTFRKRKRSTPSDSTESESSS